MLRPSSFALTLLLASTFGACRCGTALTPAEGELRVETASLSFGDVFVGASKAERLVLSNAGRAPVAVELTTSAPYSLTQTSLELAGGERREVEVRFAPAVVGVAVGALTVSGAVEVALEGTGRAMPPCPTEACADFQFSLEEGRCVRTQRPDDSACDPGCGARGQCVAGQCLAQDPGSCDDADPCTVDACGADGGCVAFPRECPVTAGCRVATCDRTLGCIESPVEDGIACAEPLCAEAKICLNGECETRPTPSAEQTCTYVDVSAHGNSVCAKNVAGGTRCWGQNRDDVLLRGFESTSVAPGVWPVGFEVGRMVAAPDVCALSLTGQLSCPQKFDGGDERYVDFSGRGLCGVLVDGGLTTCLGLPDAGRALLEPARAVWGSTTSLQCVQAADGGVGCWGFQNFFGAGDGGYGFEVVPFDAPPRDLHARRGLWALMPDGGVEVRGPTSGTGSRALEFAPTGQRPWAAMAVDTYLGFTAWGLLEDRTIEACPVASNDAGINVGRRCAPLPGNLAFTKLTAGDAFACGLDVDGGVWCWGENTFGQLGEPIVAQGPRTLPLSGVLHHERFVSCFSDGGCTVRGANGTVAFTPPAAVDDVCASALVAGGTGWFVQPDGTLTALASAPGARLLPSGTAYQTCAMQALRPDGTVARVEGFNDRWSCTLRDDGGTDCEGRTDGRFGFGPRDAGVQDVPAQHLAVPPAVALRTNGFGACVLTANGRVWCWGDSLGAPVPREEPLLGVRQLECNNGACCALRGTNGVSCWGENHFNQLGSPRAPSANPVDIAIDEPVSKLSHTADCAVLRSGRVRCWSLGGADAPLRSSMPLRVVR